MIDDCTRKITSWSAEVTDQLIMSMTQQKFGSYEKHQGNSPLLAVTMAFTDKLMKWRELIARYRVVKVILKWR